MEWFKNMKQEKTVCPKCKVNYLKELDKLLMAYPHERGQRVADRVVLDMKNLSDDIEKLQEIYDFHGDIFEPEVTDD